MTACMHDCKHQSKTHEKTPKQYSRTGAGNPDKLLKHATGKYKGYKTGQ